jgi:hypothetical protein
MTMALCQANLANSVQRKSKRRIFGAGRVEWRWIAGLGVGVGDQSIGIEAADALGLDLGPREHPVLVDCNG